MRIPLLVTALCLLISPLARARQLQSIESRRLEDRVRALEASQGVR